MDRLIVINKRYNQYGDLIPERLIILNLSQILKIQISKEWLKGEDNEPSAIAEIYLYPAGAVLIETLVKDDLLDLIDQLKHCSIRDQLFPFSLIANWENKLGLPKKDTDFNDYPF